MNLTRAELTFLAGSFDHCNPLSPFVNNRQELSGEEASALEAKGIFKDGKLTEANAKFLLPLSAPETCARMVLQKPFTMQEMYTYKSADRMILAANRGEELYLSALENGSKTAVEALDDLLPHSAVSMSRFELTLSAPATMVLLAAIDLCRVRLLGSYQTGEQCSIIFEEQDIIQQLTSNFINGLVLGLAGNCGVEMPQGESLPDLLAVLEKAGCIEADEEHKRFRLTDVYLGFARSFLIYDTQLLLQAYQLTGENSAAASFEVIFCAGMHDHISFAVSPDGFAITSLTGAEVRARIEDVMNCPRLSE